MQFNITPNDGIPIYKQIITQVKGMIGAGRLMPGDEMPSVRALARQLIVNPNTVSRAYRELEALGLLSSRQGSGTFVTATESPLAAKEKLRLITERTDALLVEAQQLGFTIDQLKTLLDKRDAKMRAQRMRTA